MKKKIWGISFVCLAMMGIICGAIFASLPKSNTVSNAYVDGFQYIGPGSGEVGMAGDGSYRLGYNITTMNDQMFNLGVRDYTNPEGYETKVRDVHGVPKNKEPYVSVPDDKAMPVFSDGDMLNIASGRVVDYGFVMLEQDEELILEITNLTTNNNVGSWMEYNHQKKAIREHTANGELLEYTRSEPENREQLWRSTDGPFTFAGTFTEEGYYSFNLVFLVRSEYGYADTKNMNFSFYIVKAENYKTNKQPSFMQEKDGNAETYKWGANGRYYYNFEGSEPYVEYNKNYFYVDIEANDYVGLPMDESELNVSSEGDVRICKFEKLGDYYLTANIVFWDANYDNGAGLEKGRFAYGPYSTRQYSLNVFGMQAYYENYNRCEASDTHETCRLCGKQAWFGGQQTYITGTTNATVSVDADISNSGIANIAALMAGNATAQKVREQVAVTNSPPVTLKGNVLSYGQADEVKNIAESTVHFNDGSGWSKIKYDKDGYYEKAGEYFIVVNYDYSASYESHPDYNETTNANPIKPQIFYFRIINYSDARIETDTGIYNFNDYMARRVEVNSAFIVYLHNGYSLTNPNRQNIGPYELSPRFELSVYEWDGTTLKDGLGFTNPRAIEPDPDDDYKVKLDFLGNDIPDGIYTFRIYYGNSHASRMDFSVAVDTELIHEYNGYTATHNLGNNKLDLGEDINNVAVFGPGEVSLEWANKTSGVGFTKYYTAEVLRYSFIVDNSYEQSTQTNNTDITSPYKLSDNFVTLRPSVMQKDDKSGWYLDTSGTENFTTGGVYFINIQDDAGTKHTFVLIVDDTAAGFAQNHASAGIINDANIVTKESVSIAYGKNKVIKTGTPENSDTLTLADYNLGNLLNISGNIVIPIPTNNHEISIDNSMYHSPNTYGVYGTATNYNSVILSDQGVYYLRSTDVLGNVTYYYVWLNRDVSQGLILEDSGADSSNPSNLANVVLPNGVAKSNNIFFSFNTKGEMGFSLENSSAGYKNIVDLIELTYYPFDFSASPNEYSANYSKNYPFGETPNVKDRLIFDSRNSVHTKQIDRATYVAAGSETINIPIPVYEVDGATTRTAPGLYIVTRYYDYTYQGDLSSLSDEELSDQVKNYFFIVDRYGVIPLDTDPFQSTIRLDMGEKSASGNSLKQTVKTNSPVKVVLPTNQTKYGGSETLTGLAYRFGWTGERLPSLDGYGMPRSDFWSSSTTGLVSAAKVSALKLNVSLQRDGTTINSINANNIGNSEFSTVSGQETTSYRVIISDGSGGVNWRPYLGDTNVISPNTSIIEFEVSTSHTQTEWILDRPGQISQTWATSSGRTSTQMNKGSDILSFVIKNSENDFYSSIDHTKTEWSINGLRLWGADIPQAVTDSTSITGVTQYKYNLTSKVLDGDEIIGVKVYSKDEFGGYTIAHNYELTIDNEKPRWNLTDKAVNSITDSIQNRDIFYSEFKVQVDNANVDYIYSLSNTFAFTFLNIQDTHAIKYQEVDLNLKNITGDETSFAYSTRAFSDIIGLKNNETRFFRITECDEAGNEITYYVQLRGNSYNNEVPATGIKGGNNLVALAESWQSSTRIFSDKTSPIRIGDTASYWDNNPFFEWEYTIGYETKRFMRLQGQTGEPVITSTSMVGNMTRTQFENWVQKMLTEGIGKTIILEINDGYGVLNNNRYDVQRLQISQMTNQATVATVTVEKFGDNIYVDIPREVRDQIRSEFSALTFTLEAYIINSNGGIGSTPDFSSDFDLGINLIGYGTEEVVIKVIDSFGREVITQFHGKTLDYKNVTFHGETAYSNGLRYVGSADGVTIIYNPSVYTLELNGEQANAFGEGYLYTVGEDGLVYVQVRPNPDGDTSAWRAVFRYRASNAVPENGVFEWQFYYCWPTVTFSNINGDDIESQVDAGEVSGMVDITIDRRGVLFDSIISYTREYESSLDRVSVGRYTTRFTLDKVGFYIISFSNEVGMNKEFRFWITDVSNLSYKVLVKETDSKGNEAWRALEQSPEKFKYGTTEYGDRYIPVYWVLSTTDEDLIIDEYLDEEKEVANTQMISQSGNVRVEPSTNHVRSLVLHWQVTGETANWRVYRLESDTSGTPVYFAIARSKDDSLNANGSTVGLKRSRNNSAFIDLGGVKDLIRTNNTGDSVITLSTAAQVVDDATNVSCTNLYYVDYYYNEVYCGRLFYDEKHGQNSLTITEEDYGIFQFYLYDWAGNQKLFNDTSFSNIPYYTIYNYKKAPVLINGETIIDEMLYTDRIDLTVLGAPLDSNDVNFMYVSQLYIELDGTPLTQKDENGVDKYNGNWFSADKKHEITLFSFSAGGRYRIVVQYHAGRQDYDPIIVTSEYVVHLVNKDQIMQNFYFGGASNIDITSVRYGGVVDTRFGEGIIKSISINTEHGVGLYQISFKIHANNIRDAFTVTREVWISSLNMSGAQLVSINGQFGGKNTKSITVTFKPNDIFAACTGEATLQVFKDNYLVTQYDIALVMILPEFLNEEDEESEEVEYDEETKLVSYNIGDIDELSDKYEELGVYTIKVTASDGTVVFADGFTIGEGMNAMVLIVLVAVAVLGVVAVVIFVRLRTKMQVR